MSFTERSYSGQLFRPAPEVHIEDDASLGVVATPWGPRSSAKKVIEVVKDYVLSARQDGEATSPFQMLTCLSSLANTLRVATMLANDSIYRDENKAEYIAGVELLLFAHQNGELAFAQVGCPHLFLAREGLPWLPLSTQMDLAAEWSSPKHWLPPIPQNMIGLHTTTNLNISSFKTKPGDRLILLSHTVAAHPLFSLPFTDAQLDTISASLAQKSPELPFWLGVVGL